MEPCGRTVPRTCLLALKFMEDAGEVAHFDKSRSILANVEELEQYLTTTAGRSQLKSRAPRMPVALLASFEMKVMDVDAS